MATLKKEQPTEKKRTMMIAALRRLAGSAPLTPSRVVQEARNPVSPLHRYFQWDTKKASYAYWLAQARELIRSVEITVVVEDRPVAVSYFVRDPRLEMATQGYIGLDDLKASPDWAKSHMEQELSAVLDRLKRAEGYATILGVRKDVEAVTRSVMALSARVSRAEASAAP